MSAFAPVRTVVVAVGLTGVLLADALALTTLDSPGPADVRANAAASPAPPTTTPTPTPALEPSPPVPAPVTASAAPPVRPRPPAQPLPPAKLLLGLTSTPDLGVPGAPTVVTVPPEGGRPTRRPSAQAIRLEQVSATNDLIVTTQVLEQTGGGPSGCSASGCTGFFGGTTEQGILLKRISTGKTKVVTRGGFDDGPVWSPDEALIAYTLLLEEADGTPRSVIALLDRTGRDRGPVALPPANQSDVMPAWSPNGRAIAAVRYRQTPQGARQAVVLLRRDGRPARTLAEGEYSQLAWSPDGRSLVAIKTDAGGKGDLWLIDVAAGGARRLTSFAPKDYPNGGLCTVSGAVIARLSSPTWSPDSRQIAFLSSYPHSKQLARQSDVQVLTVSSGRLRTAYVPPAPVCPTSGFDGPKVLADVRLYGWVR